MNRFYKFCRGLFNLVFVKICNAQIIDSDNIPRDGPIIFAGNHRTLFDPCLVFVSTDREVNFLVKKSCVNNKFIGWAFRKLGSISVDKENVNISGVRKAMDILNKNGAIGIFPEGTRNKTDKQLLQFKTGAVSLAKCTGAYIIPFGRTGEFKIGSKDLKIKFGKPFKVENLEINEANKLLKEKITELINDNKNVEIRGVSDEKIYSNIQSTGK